jgi:capsular polysaccharide transport system ATP-binding protein
MIEFVNVSKSYPMKIGRNHILQNFSFSFPEGKNIGILGKNGAGKSTIMRLIAQSEYPDSGQIIRKGKFSWPLGFAGGFSPSLTGAENLRFISRIYNADIDEVTEFVKEFSELGSFFYEPIRNYSNGMKARLSFSLSMAIDFDVVLIDEILGVGDQTFQKKCRMKIEEKAAHANIIMVTHNMDTIKAFCDIAVLLDSGSLEVYTDINEAIKIYKQS